MAQATAHLSLTHLNADTSWLLRFPVPSGTLTLLLDPWFTGTQTDFHRFFSRQAHVVPPSVTSPAELGSVDAVVVSHEFTDHCHEATLCAVNRDVPVFATKVRPIYFDLFSINSHRIRIILESCAKDHGLEPLHERAHDPHA